MKDIILKADEDLIERAQLMAQAQGKTLNAAFQEWLAQFVASANGQQASAVMKRIRHVKAGRRFTRDEMNQR